MSSTTLSQFINLEVAGQSVEIHGDGTLRFPEVSALCVADLHLGKDATFRSSGIPVPGGVNEQTLDRLSDSIRESECRDCYILGDLIHNRDSMTKEVIDGFTDFIRRHPAVNFVLVRGNHDRHIGSWPAGWTMTVEASGRIGEVSLCHDVDTSSADFRVGGHWHPVMKLTGAADSVRCRCFVLDRQHLVLPAFGEFTGGRVQRPAPGQTLFPITGSSIGRRAG